MSKNGSGSDVVTKDYLDQTLNRTLDIRLGMQKNEIIRETREMITEAHSKLYERIDPLLSEIEDRRLDRELGTEQIRKLGVRIDGNERRIKKLETS